MLRLLRPKTAVVVTLEGVLLGVALTLAGCSGGSEEEGRIRVTPAQVIGVYELKLDKGTERLEIKADGTYAQDTVSQTRSVHHTGQWHIQNHFFDGSEVILLDAAITELATPLDENPRLGFGELPMYAHDRSGKVALARNEVADWYFERTHLVSSFCGPGQRWAPGNWCPHAISSGDYYRKPNGGFLVFHGQHCPICLKARKALLVVLQEVMRYRTLAISCFVLLRAMFAVPAAIWAIFLPSLDQGLPDPIPVWERVLLGIAVFCGSWKWLLVLPPLGLGMAFTIAHLASSRKQA
jgi:hypothetical protein